MPHGIADEIALADRALPGPDCDVVLAMEHRSSSDGSTRCSVCESRCSLTRMGATRQCLTGPLQNIIRGQADRGSASARAVSGPRWRSRYPGSVIVRNRLSHRTCIPLLRSGKVISDCPPTYTRYHVQHHACCLCARYPPPVVGQSKQLRCY